MKLGDERSNYSGNISQLRLSAHLGDKFQLIRRPYSGFSLDYSQPSNIKEALRDLKALIVGPFKIYHRSMFTKKPFIF